MTGRCRFPLVVEAVNHKGAVLPNRQRGRVLRRGGCQFHVLRRRRNEPEAFLYAFDLLELDGTDLRREPIGCARRRWPASCGRAVNVRLKTHKKLRSDGVSARLQDGPKRGSS